MFPGVHALNEKDKTETARRQEELLRWVFAFAALDVKDIKTREAQRQLKELVIVQFCDARRLLLADWISTGNVGRRRALKARFVNDSAFRKQVRQPTKAEIIAIHGWLGEFIKQGRPIVVSYAVEPAPTVVNSSLQTEMRGIPRVDHRKLPYKASLYQASGRFSPLPAVEKKDRHYAAIVSVLEEFESTIARCEVESCSKLFLRVRRQRYCSQQCTQSVQSKAWYRRKRKEILARKQQRYAERVKRTNPNLGVGRRKSDRGTPHAKKEAKR